MRSLAIVVMVSAVPASGCKDEVDGPAAVAKMRELTARMCACRGKEKRCQDDVQDAMAAWGQARAKNADGTAIEFDKKTRKELDALGRQYGECMSITCCVPPETGSAGAVP
jgi:hypothetical protein